jgi:hypothetical protein
MHPISPERRGEMHMPRPFSPASLAAQRRRPQTAAAPGLRVGAALRPAEPPRRDAATRPPPPARGEPR